MTQALGIIAIAAVIFVVGVVDYMVSLKRYRSLGWRKELSISMKVYGSASAFFALLAALIMVIS